ncbi:MAG: hypothetical protein Q8S13_07365 [Dehalococcoidia bacterium]|nr:hypothetical protein [Dehalococcoidia bacterium]
MAGVGEDGLGEGGAAAAAPEAAGVLLEGVAQGAEADLLLDAGESEEEVAGVGIGEEGVDEAVELLGAAAMPKGVEVAGRGAPCSGGWRPGV